MKKSISAFLVLLLFISFAEAQSPLSIPYQAIARNASGNLIPGQNISLRFSIHNGTAAGTIVYQETQSATTNTLGLFSVNIGQGTVAAGTFAGINWGSGAKFMQVELDVTGGTTYVDMGTQQMMSVPYAQYANNGMPSGNAPGSMLYWDGSQWLQIAPGSNQQSLTYCDGIPTWGPCPPKLPTVTTNAIGSISYNYADCGGNVTDGGFATVTSRGICWNTSPNPTLANFSSTNGAGTGTGTFLVFAGNLTPGTTYYLKAFATNVVGTAYGNEVSFTTLPATVPTAFTQGVFNISFNNATGYGSVGSNGGLTVIMQGICWSINPGPTIADDYMPDFFNNPFNFNVPMSGLSQGTTYYVRAYATNSMGTGYGNEITFSTLGNSVPILSTTTMSGILATTASSGGNITSGGGSTITARGICLSTNPNPTVANTVVSGGSGTGSFSCNLTGLVSNTTYYVRAFATNTTGTGYGNEISFTSSPYTLGQSFGGGKIFYIDGSTGQHGLIAANTDGINSGSIFWFNGNAAFVASGTGIGAGITNTTALFNALGGASVPGLCKTYNGGGFTDWFLPSRDECVLMIQNGAFIGITPGAYWTSTQVSNSIVVAVGSNAIPFSVQQFGVSIYCYRQVRAF